MTYSTFKNDITSPQIVSFKLNIKTLFKLKIFMPEYSVKCIKSKEMPYKNGPLDIPEVGSGV